MLDAPRSADRSYCFGPFRLDIARQQLYKDGQPVELARRLVRTLQLLVENHGKDLEKTYLMEQLWPDTVVEEHNLTVIISMLRKVLGDDGEHKKYILTNPGRGYRFVGEVIEAGSDGPPAQAAQAPGTVPENPSTHRRSFLQRYGSLPLIGLAAGLFFLLIFLLIFLALFSVHEWNQRQITQSIAVLPFRSLDAERDDGYLGLGMADGLITRLRNIRHIVVRPTVDVAQYQNTAYDPLALGKELNVVSLVDGTVQRTGDQISLRVKLLRVKDGAVLWAHEYHGRFADILSLQDQIADQATRALALKLNTAEQQSIHRHYTGNSDAYQLYIAGHFNCSSDSGERTLVKGIAYFQQAITKDPQFALAYSSLAGCYIRLGTLDDRVPKEFLPKAEEAAQRALAIDATMEEAYLPLALAKTYYDWDYQGAELAFRKGIDLAPQDSEAHLQYAQFLVAMGRFQEADSEVHLAEELDPFSWRANTTVGSIYFFGHHYKEATDRWEKRLALDPDEAPWFLGWIYASQGRTTSLIDDLEKTEATASRKTAFTAPLAYLYALRGSKAQAEKYLLLLAQYPGGADEYDAALIHTALGDKDKALELLERAKEQRSLGIIFVKVDPRFESLHSDPRFNELVRSVHLNPKE